MSILYNIIVEVMYDGAGDWAYATYLLELLLSIGVKEDQIRIIYINTFEYGKDLNDLINDKLESNIKLLKCKVINGKNITDARSTNLEIIKYTFKNNNGYFNKTKSIEKINTIKDKLYNVDEEHLYSNDFNKIFNIINELLKGFKVPENNINYGDYYCEVKKTDLEANNINLTDLYNTNVRNLGYPFNRIGSLLFHKYKNISIIYLDYFSGQSISNNNIFKNCINILFRTQYDNGNYNFPNLISIREGGHSRDNSLNCSIRNGFIRAKVEGDRTIFETYCRDNNIIPLNSHVCYISVETDDIISTKLSKFIKILCYSKEIENNNKILMIGNWDELFSEINIINPKRQLDLDIVRGVPNNNEITVTFNDKNLIIKKINSISLGNNGFNFSYLLNETNSYCMLSGDTSYMEGLTLNKKVIHVGMQNKYEMINEINEQIITNINNTKFNDIKDTEKSIYGVIIKDTEKYIDGINGFIITKYHQYLKLYAELLSHPRYLEIQKSLTSKNFDTKIIAKIEDMRSQNIFKEKYLKYKEKYLQLKSI